MTEVETLNPESEDVVGGGVPAVLMHGELWGPHGLLDS